MMRFKTSILVFILALGFLLPGTVPSASAGEDGYFKFLNDVSNKYTRRDYVADFFTLSYCQINDILEVYEQMDSIKNQMRNAAMNGESTNTYETQYKELLMEVYFIRELSEQDMSGLTEDELEDIEAQKAKILSELKSEMRDAFVNDVGFVSDGTLEDYFAVWSEEYDEMVVKYKRCEEGAWWELYETWTDLKETWQDLGDTLKNVPNQFEKADTSLKERLLSPIKSKIDEWKAKKEQEKLEKIENVEAEKSVADVVQEDGISSFQQALDALVENSETHQISSDSAERMARYSELYGEGGSLAASNMQGIIQTMNLTITDATVNYLPQLEEATEKIFDKQCN
jgi:hypothetical protein